MRVHIDDDSIVISRETVDAYEVIYLSSLLDEFDTVDMVLSRAPASIEDVEDEPESSDLKTGGNTKSEKTAKAEPPTQVQARFVGVPYYGDATVVETRSGDVATAIEACFARTRRAILRQHRLAALAG